MAQRKADVSVRQGRQECDGDDGRRNTARDIANVSARMRSAVSPWKGCGAYWQRALKILSARTMNGNGGCADHHETLKSKQSRPMSPRSRARSRGGRHQGRELCSDIASLTCQNVSSDSDSVAASDTRHRIPASLRLSSWTTLSSVRDS